jgi:hypothetical protein
VRETTFRRSLKILQNTRIVLLKMFWMSQSIVVSWHFALAVRSAMRLGIGMRYQEFTKRAKGETHTGIEYYTKIHLQSSLLRRKTIIRTTSGACVVISNFFPVNWRRFRPVFHKTPLR